MNRSELKRLRRKIHVRYEVSRFFKGWGKYLTLAFVALVAFNAERYLRALPSNTTLNYAVYVLGAVTVAGALLLRHSKWQRDYTKLVLRSIAWVFGTIGIIFLDFPRDLVSFFSLKFSPLNNLALALAIVTELSLVGLMFWAGDGAKDSERTLEATWMKKDATPDYDAS